MSGHDVATSRLFVSLWATFTLAHHLKQLPLSPEEPWPVTLSRLAMGAVAVFVLARPGAFAAVTALAALQIVGVALQLPSMSNAWLLAGLLAIGVLSGQVAAWRAGRATVEDGWRRYAPTLRLGLVVFYGFAALAKLNRDFFDPAVSCAPAFLDHMATTLPVPLGSPAVDRLAIWATVVAEAGIPLLFLSERTRRYGILVGVLFHGLIAASPAVHVFDFSLLMYTLYVAMAPPDLGHRLAHHPSLGLWRAVARRRVPLALAATAAVLAMHALSPSTAPLFVLRTHLWNALALFLGVAAFVALLGAGDASLSPARSWRLPDRFGLVAVALVALNGAAPYLGLKTTASFTMFSNLRTEEGVENSLIVPPALRVFGMQDDLVEVVDSSAPALRALRGSLLVPFDLQRRAHRLPEATLHLRRGDEVRVIDRIGDDPLGAPPSALLLKTMDFRPVEPGSQRCRW